MDRYRKEIDTIDEKIAELLDRRLDVAEKIGQFKLKKGLPVMDEKREREKVDSFVHRFGEDKRDHVAGVIRAIMESSRNYQESRRFEYGLLGKHLGHSLSPQVHKALGGYEYGLIELDEEELGRFFDVFPFGGISVTMPYKRAVMKYLDDICDEAKAVDSVNTIVRNEEGALIGYNTDYDGFKYTLEKSGVDVKGSKCIVLGSGGVSGTVKKVLEDCGADRVIIISRKGDDNYDNLDRHYDADIVVNATPVGMYPEPGTSPVDIKEFQNCRGVFDLIYNPLRTKFLLDAENLGIPAFSGMKMLVAQAARACFLFTGKDCFDRIEEVTESIVKDRENIVLIGMPGSGKTSVGRKLAELTGKKFCDSDESIKAAFEKTAEEVIVSEGEESFRDKETEIIKRIAKEGGQVIAAGGGVVERRENRNILRANGRIVYIKRDLDRLSRKGRPISKAEGIEVLYERRRPAYESWQDLTVENRSINKTAETIKEKLEY